ncbi:MAG: hypothetical protein WD077_01795 [Bacteroidia bacterium]
MKEKKRYKFSSLARPIELDLVTNNAIAVIAILVLLLGIIVKSVGGMPILEALWWGVQASLSMFLTWVLARELDPANELAAFVALPVAATGYYFFGFPDWLLTFYLIGIFRIINKSVGLPIKVLDVALVLLAGGWLLYDGSLLMVGLMPLPFLLDALLPQKDMRQLASFVLAAGIVAVISVFSNLTFPTPTASVPLLLSAGVLVLSAIPVLIFIHRPSTVADATGEKLHSIRVRATIIVAVLTCFAGSFLYGTFGISDLILLWAALGGVYLYRFSSIFIPKTQKREIQDDRSPDDPVF